MAKRVDASGQYTFETWTRNGKTYKQAYGWLGMPDKVIQHRSSSAQKGVAGGTGDDAGHLIGNRFGSPGDARNLSLQNWKANRYGTYKNLENEWAQKRRSRTEIYVQVTDVTRGGEDRPFMRNVQWIERVKGHEMSFEVDFANAHTPESRSAQSISPTDVGGRDAQIIRVDFQKRQRIP
jgi:hypothetical protein